MDAATVEVLPNGTSLSQHILSKVKVAKKEDETAFYMMDLDRLLKQHQDWVEAMPSVKPYFSMKTNPDPVLLKTLAALGTGFDCGNKEEIQTILDLGVPTDRIMFANPCKLLSHIQYAAENNVQMVAFDSDAELRRIKSYFPAAQLVVRIVADDPTSPYPLGSKYGCTLPEAYKLLETAKELGMDVAGVCFHVGSYSKDPTTFKVALEITAKIFQYGEKLGYHLTVVDVGGGFPACAGPAEVELFKRQASAINEGLQQYFSAYQNLKIIGEPGTYFCCSTHNLMVRVIGKRVVNRTSEDPSSGLFMYYISDGIYGSFNMVLHGFPPPTPTVIREDESTSNAQCFKSTLWGPSLDSHDKVYDAISLPEVDVGEWLRIKDMGAYTESSASKFNAMQPSKNYYCVSEANSKRLQEFGIPLQ